MKALFTALFTSLATLGYAQTEPSPTAVATHPTDAATGLLDYTDVVPVTSASKLDLFARAKLWLATSYKSAKDVVQTEDKDLGLLVGKGYTNVPIQSGKVVLPEKLYYTLKLNFKDGKYKYELTDFYFESEPLAALGGRVIKTPAEKWVLPEPQNNQSGKIIGQYRTQFDLTVQNLIASLKAGMLKSNDF